MTFDTLRFLRGELRRSLHGQAWHGPALCEALADVSVSEAFARPESGAHSIAQLALHAVAQAGGNACGAGGETMDDPWQLVAKGIEDMQIKYTMADGTTADTPATVVDGSYGTLTKEVRVTLTSRSEVANLTGGRNGANAPDPKVRGSLTSVGTPRAALFVLSKAPTPEWR